MNVAVINLYLKEEVKEIITGFVITERPRLICYMHTIVS